MGSVFLHYVTGLFISLMSNASQSQPRRSEGLSGRNPPTKHELKLAKNTDTAIRIYGLNMSVFLLTGGSSVFNSWVYLSLRVNCLPLSAAGVNTTL